MFLLDANNVEFPPTELANPDGLIAVGGDLSVKRLLSAYSKGIFPWYDDQSPILWWSPNPRCVLFPAKLHIPKSLKKVLNSQKFSFSIDSAFAEVIQNCAQTKRQGQDSTWIIPKMVEAYIELHKLGKAHSVEVWENNELVGGIYGLAMGKAFFGESMFYKSPNASKIAFVYFVKYLQDLNFQIIDCQQATEHLLRFGAEMISRTEFNQILERVVYLPELCLAKTALQK